MSEKQGNPVLGLILCVLLLGLFLTCNHTPSKTAPRSPANQQTGDSGWDGMTQAQKERWCEMDMETRIIPNTVKRERDWSNKNVR